MKIWILEKENGGALCEIEHSAIKVEFRDGYASVDAAVAAMAEQYPDIVPTIERLAQPELKLGDA